MENTLNNLAAKAAKLAASHGSDTETAQAQDTKAEAPVAVVHYVVRQNGSFNWLRNGQKRVIVRVSVVQDPDGSLRCNSNNVLEILYESGDRITGTTDRSAYWPGRSLANARKVAAEYNASRAA